MRKLPTIVFLLLLITTGCIKEKSSVIEISFDNEWKFSLNDQEEAYTVAFNDDSWDEISIPHDFSILQPFEKHNTSGRGGGYAYGGTGWYRKNFHLPKEAKDKRVTVTFNGVYKNSEVWINEHYLGKRPNGYIGFTYDLTPYINYKGKNLLAVKTDSEEQPASRWYTGSGIYRHVNLHISDPTHFVRDGIFIQTTSLDSSKAELTISAEVMSNSPKAKACGFRVTITDPQGRELIQKTTTVQIRPDEVNTIEKKLKIKAPELWDIEHPALYSIKAELVQKKRILDSELISYGLRNFHFDPEKGFFLNGRHIKLKGTNNHHDGGPLGAACYDYTFERQLQILKEMGSNALRMSHNPPAPEMLDMADRMGFVVINEIFDEWKYGKVPHNYADDFDRWYQQDIADWMRRDRNHPSVVAWSLGNEIPEQRSGEKGKELLLKLMDTASKYDTTRPFTSACNELIDANESGFASALDIVGYNYREPNYKTDHQTYPDRVIYGSETVIYPYQPGDGFPLHSYSDWLEGQLEDYVAGEFLWTGFDYLGESGIGMGGTGLAPWNEWPSWPWRSAICGVVDICGFPKPAYYFRKALWTEEPMVYIAVPFSQKGNDIQNVPFWGWPDVLPHWNNPALTENLKIQVYTNCNDVELLLNGHSLGSKNWDIKKEAFLTWDVPYAPGKLEAIGKTFAGDTTSFSIQTAGKASILELKTNKSVLNTDKQDLSYIELNLNDTNGNLCHFQDKEIEFSIEGEGEILAVGNGNPESHTPFHGNKIETYHGKCLAIVKTTGKAGEIVLKAQSTDLLPTTITLFGRH